MNGNSCPFHYVRMLHRKGIDSELLLPEGNIISHPLWEIANTDIKEILEEQEHPKYPKKWVAENRDKVPEWVHLVEYDNKYTIEEKRYSDPRFFMKMIKLVRDSNSDLIHAWGIMGAIWASFSRKPYIYHVTGYRDWNNWKRVKNPVKRRIFRLFTHRAINRSERVIAGPNTKDVLESTLNIETTNLEHVMDTEFFKPSSYQNNLKKEYGCETLLFAGARQRWEVKRNNKIINAFNQLKDRDDIHMIISEWGGDAEKTKNLVQKLGLKEDVSFVPLMSRPKMIRTINSSDAVLDQFGNFNFGSFAIQTLSCGTPLISALDQRKLEKAFSTKIQPPVLDAATPSEIGNKIRKIQEKEFNKKISAESRNWIKEYYSWEPLIEEYISLYNNILSGLRQS